MICLSVGVGGLAVLQPECAAFAQDLNVVTKVSRLQRPQDRWQPLARSLTLFHGGKAYDHVEEVGEVVIHEPAQSQFVILSLSGNKMATRVRYEELLRFLKVARAETRKYREEQLAASLPNNRAAIQALEFQLHPQFAETFDAATDKLRLSSQFVNYEVATATVERAGIVRQYLDWADWTARLNYVLHPQAVTPEARIELNNALRRRDRLPTQVDLAVTIDSPLRLRAEHTFVWSLRSFDRDSIAKWEKIRTADDLRWVSLREYQRVLVTASNRRGR